jgi:hypothetical protein
VGSVRLGWPRRGETAEERGDGGLAMFDGGAFIVGKRNVHHHALQVVLGLDELAGTGCLRILEVATGAGHPVRHRLKNV